MSDDRDWADSSYVRVYQSVKRRDGKFRDVYYDDRAFAAWVRLLLDADPVHPAPASIPAHLSKYARTALVKAGILKIDGLTYTLSGMDKERSSRAMTGAERSRAYRERQNARATSSDVTPVTKGDVTSETPRGRAGASVSVSVSDSLRTTEEGAGGNQDLPPLTVMVDYLIERTGRSWHGRPGERLFDTLEDDLRDFGVDRLLAEYKRWPGERLDHGQIVFGVTKLLHPSPSRLPTPAEVKKAEEDRELERVIQARKARMEREAKAQ